jgi:hypothetical protein
LELLRRPRFGQKPLDFLLEGSTILTLDVEFVLQRGNEGVVGAATGDRSRRGAREHRGERGRTRNYLGWSRALLVARGLLPPTLRLNGFTELHDSSFGGLELAFPFEERATMGG